MEVARANAHRRSFFAHESRAQNFVLVLGERGSSLTFGKKVQTKSEILSSICASLLAGNRDRAAEIARAEYPFAAPHKNGRVYTELQSLLVFRRDGFIDRYSGDRLVFPGALRIISRVLPEEFPMHPNWKMSESHLVYWEMFPTVDHLEPVARGGLDQESNWITTSMVRNSAKANWTMVELGWQIFPAGDLRDWDGLTGWFFDFVAAYPSHLEDEYVRRWHRAAFRTKKEPNKAPEPTTMAVTIRAPSSTARASHGRGSS